MRLIGMIFVGNQTQFVPQEPATRASRAGVFSMKTKFSYGAVSILAFGAALGATTIIREDPAMKAMKEKWEVYAKPGEAHKLLDAHVGTWKTTTKCYQTPGAPAEETQGTSTMKWIYDGRFIEQELQGTVMGMPYEGRGSMGYDNLKKKYVSTWLDNMGTGICQFEGTYDPASKTFTYTGEMPDVMAGKYTKARLVDKQADPDHWIFQIYGTGPDGKEMLKMQCDYTRTKG
jgi:hypothetical protein